MKYGSVKEEERWEKVILKKLNETVRTARKRYRRVHNMPAPTGIDSVGRISMYCTLIFIVLIIQKLRLTKSPRLIQGTILKDLHGVSSLLTTILLMPDYDLSI